MALNHYFMAEQFVWKLAGAAQLVKISSCWEKLMISTMLLSDNHSFTSLKFRRKADFIKEK